MGDQIATPVDPRNAASRIAPAWAMQCVWRWIASRRSRAGFAGLSEWILRDIGVTRECAIGTGVTADPREAVRQFWLTSPHPPTI